MSEVMEQPIAQSNAPTVDLAAALEPKALQVWINYQYSEHAAQRDRYAAMHARFEVLTKDGIPDEEVSGRTTEAVKEVNAEITALDATRSTIKAPVLHAQRLIDGDAKTIKDGLLAIVSSMLAKQTAWLNAKAERIRGEAEAEAARKEAEAQALIEAAAQSGSIEDREAAIEVIGEAQTAAALAAAPVLELTRTRSTGGVLTGLKDNWQYRVTDLTKVPAVYLTINDVMVKASMKSSGKNIKDLKIDGIEFYNDAKAYVR